MRILPRYSRIRSIDVSMVHRKSIDWLEERLRELQGIKCVVVTHHEPSEKSVPEQYIGDVVTSSYAFSLESTILKYTPSPWRPGHLHNSSSYKIGDCHMV